MKISGAVFDVDGTLVDSLGYWELLWREIGKRYKNDESFVPDSKVEKEIRTLPLDKAMEYMHTSCAVGKDGHELFILADDMLRRYYEDIVELKPGAYELLSALHERGIPMCIASASSVELLTVIIKKFDLSEFFGEIFSCADIGKGKEFPDVFIMARDYLGTSPEETWVFEDSATAIETAHNAGFKTVGVYDKHSASQQKKVCDNSSVYLGEDKNLSYIVASL